MTVAAAEQLVGRYIFLHAGAVARDDRAVVLPAASGVGKSTLVAAPVGHGFTCLGDDIVVYDADRAALIPFVRSISLKAGAAPLLTPFYAQPLPERAAYRFGQKLVSFVTPGEQAWPRAPVVAAIVFPEHVTTGPATRSPLSRTEGLPRFLAQCSSHHRLGATAVRIALDIVRQADCWVLRYGDLTDAVDLLESALA